MQDEILRLALLAQHFDVAQCGEFVEPDLRSASGYRMQEARKTKGRRTKDEKNNWIQDAGYR